MTRICRRHRRVSVDGAEPVAGGPPVPVTQLPIYDLVVCTGLMREHLGWTFEQCAEVAGVNRETIRKIYRRAQDA